jgi:hypothetical protein
MPPPQGWLQAFQLLQAETTHLMGHSRSSHLRLSVSTLSAEFNVEWQVLPPALGHWTTVLLRCCSPAPQLAEQRCHFPHADIVQSTGHLFVLHSIDDTSPVQSAPP